MFVIQSREDDSVLLIPGLVRVRGPVHLVVALRREDAARHAIPLHLGDEVFERTLDLVGVARIHLHFDRHRAVVCIFPETEELDRTGHDRSQNSSLRAS